MLIAVVSRTPHVFFFLVPSAPFGFEISPPSSSFRVPPSSTFRSRSDFPSIHVCDFFSFLAQEAALYIWNLAPSSFGISHSSSFRNFHHPYLGCFHHPTPRVLILPLPNFLSNRDFRNPLLPSTFHRLMRPFSELTPPSPSSPSFHAAVTMNSFSAFCSSVMAAAEYFRTPFGVNATRSAGYDSETLYV